MDTVNCSPQISQMTYKVKRHLHWFFFALFLILGTIVIYFLNKDFQNKEIENRNVKLVYQHEQAVQEFTNSIDKFAGLVSGMRSFMNLSPELPSAAIFQKFVQNQFNDIGSEDSIVISLIDTTHVFRQSFTRTSMNPSGLVGTSVASLRSEKKLALLNALMQHDSLRVFPPINLYEGWGGLPINFRVKKDGAVYGYVAAIIDFNSVLRTIYADAETTEFIHQFTSADNTDIDRSQAHDDTKVYHDVVDVEYYQNFAETNTKFLYTTKEYYGYSFKIGTAYKDSFLGSSGYSRILLFWYLTFALLALIVALQLEGIKRLNRRIIKTNTILNRRRTDIQLQNLELKKLTKTQNKFFSIIGHDIKQPLNSIEGLLYLLKDEEIQNPNLVEIIKNLKDATGSTVGLLNNLLRWAMSQSGDMQFDSIALDMESLIASEIKGLIPLASEKHITLNQNIQTPLFYQGDSDMLRTIIRNLVSNAIKFSSSNGEVAITAERKGYTLFITVLDSGIGMTKEDVKSLFKIGKQISTIGTNGETGTGLGLVLCCDFANKHGGTIKVKSTLGEGTEFTVQLPYSF